MSTSKVSSAMCSVCGVLMAILCMVVNIDSANARSCFLPSGNCDVVIPLPELCNEPRAIAGCDCQRCANGYYKCDNCSGGCIYSNPKDNYDCAKCANGKWTCDGCKVGYIECTQNGVTGCYNREVEHGTRYESDCDVHCDAGYTKVTENGRDKCVIDCSTIPHSKRAGDVCVCVDGYTMKDGRCDKNCPENKHDENDVCVCDAGYEACENGSCIPACGLDKSFNKSKCECEYCQSGECNCSDGESCEKDANGHCSCKVDCGKKGFVIDGEEEILKCYMSSVTYSSKASFASISPSAVSDASSDASGLSEGTITCASSGRYKSYDTSLHAALATAVPWYVPLDETTAALYQRIASGAVNGASCGGVCPFDNRFVTQCGCTNGGILLPKGSAANQWMCYSCQENGYSLPDATSMLVEQTGGSCNHCNDTRDWVKGCQCPAGFRMVKGVGCVDNAYDTVSDSVSEDEFVDECPNYGFSPYYAYELNWNCTDQCTQVGSAHYENYRSCNCDKTIDASHHCVDIDDEGVSDVASEGFVPPTPNPELTCKQKGYHRATMEDLRYQSAPGVLGGGYCNWCQDEYGYDWVKGCGCTGGYVWNDLYGCVSPDLNVCTMKGYERQGSLTPPNNYILRSVHGRCESCVQSNGWYYGDCSCYTGYNYSATARDCISDAISESDSPSDAMSDGEGPEPTPYACDESFHAPDAEETLINNSTYGRCEYCTDTEFRVRNCSCEYGSSFVAGVGCLDPSVATCLSRGYVKSYELTSPDNYIFRSKNGHCYSCNTNGGEIYYGHCSCYTGYHYDSSIHDCVKDPEPEPCSYSDASSDGVFDSCSDAPRPSPSPSGSCEQDGFHVATADDYAFFLNSRKGECGLCMNEGSDDLWVKDCHCNYNYIFEEGVGCVTGYETCSQRGFHLPNERENLIYNSGFYGSCDTCFDSLSVMVKDCQCAEGSRFSVGVGCEPEGYSDCYSDSVSGCQPPEPVNMCNGYTYASMRSRNIMNNGNGSCDVCRYDSNYVKNCHCYEGYTYASGEGKCVHDDEVVNLVGTIQNLGGNCDACTSDNKKWKCTLNSMDITSQDQLCLALGYKYDTSLISTGGGYVSLGENGESKIANFRAALKSSGLNGNCESCEYAAKDVDGKCTQSRYKCYVEGDCADYTDTSESATNKRAHGYTCKLCPLCSLDKDYCKYKCVYGGCVNAGYSIDLTKAKTNTGARDYTASNSTYGNNFRTRIAEINRYYDYVSAGYYDGKTDAISDSVSGENYVPVYDILTCPSLEDGSENFVKVKDNRWSRFVTEDMCPNVNDGFGKYNVQYNSTVFRKIKALVAKNNAAPVYPDVYSDSISDNYSDGYSDGYSGTTPRPNPRPSNRCTNSGYHLPQTALEMRFAGSSYCLNCSYGDEMYVKDCGSCHGVGELWNGYTCLPCNMQGYMLDENNNCVRVDDTISDGYSDGYSGMAPHAVMGVYDMALIDEAAMTSFGEVVNNEYYTGCWRCPFDTSNQWYTCRYQGVNVSTTGEMCKVLDKSAATKAELLQYQLTDTGMRITSSDISKYCKRCPFDSNYYVNCNFDAMCKNKGYIEFNPLASSDLYSCSSCATSLGFGNTNYTKCECGDNAFYDPKIHDCKSCDRPCKTTTYFEQFSDASSDAVSGSWVSYQTCTDACGSAYFNKSEKEGYKCYECTCPDSAYYGRYKCVSEPCPDKILNGGYSTVDKTKDGYDCSIVAKCGGKTYYDCSCAYEKIEIDGKCTEDLCDSYGFSPYYATNLNFECTDQCTQEGSPHYGNYRSCVCPNGHILDMNTHKCIPEEEPCFDRLSDGYSDGYGCATTCTGYTNVNKASQQMKAILNDPHGSCDVCSTNRNYIRNCNCNTGYEYTLEYGVGSCKTPDEANLCLRYGYHEPSEEEVLLNNSANGGCNTCTYGGNLYVKGCDECGRGEVWTRQSGGAACVCGQTGYHQSSSNGECLYCDTSNGSVWTGDSCCNVNHGKIWDGENCIDVVSDASEPYSDDYSDAYSGCSGYNYMNLTQRIINYSQHGSCDICSYNTDYVKDCRCDKGYVFSFIDRDCIPRNCEYGYVFSYVENGCVPEQCQAYDFSPAYVDLGWTCTDQCTQAGSAHYGNYRSCTCSGDYEIDIDTHRCVLKENPVDPDEPVDEGCSDASSDGCVSPIPPINNCLNEDYHLPSATEALLNSSGDGGCYQCEFGGKIYVKNCRKCEEGKLWLTDRGGSGYCFCGKEGYHQVGNDGCVWCDERYDRVWLGDFCVSRSEYESLSDAFSQSMVDYYDKRYCENNGYHSATDAERNLMREKGRCSMCSLDSDYVKNCRCTATGYKWNGSACVCDEEKGYYDIGDGTCGDGLLKPWNDLSGECEETCSNGYVLNQFDCECYCPRHQGKVEYNDSCIDDPCPGDYKEAIDGYTCTGRCEDARSPNYEKYASCSCNGVTVGNYCISSVQQACASKGYDYTSVPTNGGYDCEQCEIGGHKYSYYKCQPKSCPTGYVAGMTCHGPYEKQMNGYSGEEECVTCVDKCRNKHGNSMAPMDGYNCSALCTSGSITYYNCTDRCAGYNYDYNPSNGCQYTTKCEVNGSPNYGKYKYRNCDGVSDGMSDAAPTPNTCDESFHAPDAEETLINNSTYGRCEYCTDTEPRVRNCSCEYGSSFVAGVGCVRNENSDSVSDNE